jgi:hypothetical protein
MVPARLGMSGRLRISLTLAMALALGTVACGPSLGDINGDPPRYYEQKVSVRARVSRRQIFPDETLLELADAKGRRILARLKGDSPPAIDSWVKVKGVLVAEIRVGGQLAYDVIAIESLRSSRAPRFTGWF